MFIHYKVKYFDEVDFQEMEEEGITSGKYISDAIERICDYYGKNNISSMYLDYEFGDSFTTDDDCTLLIMKKQIYSRREPTIRGYGVISSRASLKNLWRNPSGRTSRYPYQL